MQSTAYHIAVNHVLKLESSQEDDARATLWLVDWAEYSLLHYVRGCMARLTSAPLGLYGESLEEDDMKAARKRFPGRFACKVAVDQPLSFLSEYKLCPLGETALAYRVKLWDEVLGCELLPSVWKGALFSLQASLNTLREDLSSLNTLREDLSQDGAFPGAWLWFRRAVEALPDVPSGFDDARVVAAPVSQYPTKSPGCS